MSFERMDVDRLSDDVKRVLELSLREALSHGRVTVTLADLIAGGIHYYRFDFRWKEATAKATEAARDLSEAVKAATEREHFLVRLARRLVR